MTDTQAGLLPCPFCGAPAELEHGSDHHGTWFNLGCSRHWGKDPDNHCIGGRIWYTEVDTPEADAIKTWNTRPSTPASAEVAYTVWGWAEEANGKITLYTTPSAAREATERGAVLEQLYTRNISRAIQASGAAVQVPEDATDEMVEAGARAVEQGIVHLSAGYFRKIWKAMLAAAPQKQGA